MRHRHSSNIAKYDFTNRFNFIKGNFKLSKVPIPYYMFSMPLSNVANDLTLVADLNEISSELYDVNNVFQRNIDTNRVEKDIVKGYLNNFEKIKFFNPITIAFIPIENKKVVKEYEELDLPNEILNLTFDDGTNDKLVEEYDITKNLSNIILFERKDSELGQITWDRKTVKAIAVDGQHRLYALKKFVADRPDFKDVLIPIIAIVFDDFQDRTLTEYLREIFIDINKNAKPVSKTRNILLDDREIASILTKDMIKSDTKNEEGNENSLNPEILDWQSDNPKPDGSFQLTTVMLLHRIFSELYLQNKELTTSNSFDPEAIEKFTNMVNRKFDIDKLIQDKNLDVITISKHAQDIIDNGQTFSLNTKHNQLILESFRKKYKPIIYKIYTQLEPYKSFVQIAKEEKIFEKGNPLNEYIRLPLGEKRELFIKNHNDSISDGTNNGNKINIKEIESKFNNIKNDNLLFNMIGQVAVFKIVEKQLFKSFDSDSSLEDFINAINFINTKNNFFYKFYKLDSKRFLWDSLATSKKGERISATNTSIDNISNILMLLFISYRIFKIEKYPIENYEKIIIGEVDKLGDEKSPENTYVRSLCTKIINRLQMERKNLDDSKDDNELNALAKSDLLKLIKILSGIIIE